MSDVEERQRKVLELSQKDSCIKIGNKIIQFARATEKDLRHIQQLSTEELILKHFNLIKAMSYSVSVMDCEIEILMALELEKRGVTPAQYKKVLKSRCDKTRR